MARVIEYTESPPHEKCDEPRNCYCGCICCRVTRNNKYAEEIEVVDEGTLDTVLRCKICDTVGRYMYDGLVEPGYTYEMFVQDSASEFAWDHTCSWPSTTTSPT